MVLYAALTVLSVVAAALLLWALRGLNRTGRSTYRALSQPGRRKGSVRYAHLNTSLAQTPRPWGWGQARNHPGQVRSFGRSDGHHHAQPVGGSRHTGPRGYQTMTQSARNALSGYDLNKKNPITDTSSWPYRDDEFGATSTQNGSNPPRGATPRSRSGSKKPWGW